MGVFPSGQMPPSWVMVREPRVRVMFRLRVWICLRVLKRPLDSLLEHLFDMGLSPNVAPEDFGDFYAYFPHR